MRNSEYHGVLQENTLTEFRSPLFVTWNIKSGRDWRLRGCIGNFEPMPIHEGLAEYALISAFRDHRFKTIDKSELERLQCV